LIDNDKNKGAKITSWNFNGGPNQSWDFETVGGQPPVSGDPHYGASTYGGQQRYRRRDYIRNESNTVPARIIVKYFFKRRTNCNNKMSCIMQMFSCLLSYEVP